MAHTSNQHKLVCFKDTGIKPRMKDAQSKVLHGSVKMCDWQNYGYGSFLQKTAELMEEPAFLPGAIPAWRYEFTNTLNNCVIIGSSVSL